MRFPIFGFGKKKNEELPVPEETEFSDDFSDPEFVSEQGGEPVGSGAKSTPVSTDPEMAGAFAISEDTGKAGTVPATESASSVEEFTPLPVFGNASRRSVLQEESGDTRKDAMPMGSDRVPEKRIPGNAAGASSSVKSDLQIHDPYSRASLMERKKEEDLSDTLILEESVTVRLDLRDTSSRPGADAAQRWSAPVVRIGCFSHKGTRDYQQDALAFKMDEWTRTSRSRAAAVLCDGMGGLNAGEKASGHASGRLLEELDVSWSEFPEIYPDALSDINYEIAHLKDRSGAFLKTGTTVVSAVIENGGMFYASVGDSRIYLYRDRRLIGLTRDHTYGNQLDDMVSAGKITPEEARGSANRAALTSYLGSRRLEQIQYNREELRLIPGDIVLLCSDGLYKSLNPEEIANIMSLCEPDVALAARRLVEKAVGRPGRHDNTSVLLMGYAVN